MELSDRKKKILQYVVDDYIETAVPVSSKSLTERHLKDISSATVRNELSALEELGYLTQLHTSSGRVPSAEAYKLYVSDLMVKDKLSAKELDYIKKIFLEKADNLEEVIKNTTKVISELTSYTSVGIQSHDLSEKIVSIKFFRYKPDSALVIIVTEMRLLKDNFIAVPESMTEEQLKDAEKVLDNMCRNKTFGEICEMKPEMEDSFMGYKNIFVNVIEALKTYVQTTGDDVVTAGEDKILDHPEYADIGKIKDFLSVVTSKDKVMTLLSGDNRDIKINVKIGADGYDEIPKECSLVTATYSANGNKLGTYGVIGPIRMDYQNQHQYDDILNLPHPTSKNHPRMSLHDRAAQFSPFAALTGHEAAIKETARLTDDKQILSEDVIEKINGQLKIIAENIGAEQEITVTYFVPDSKKSGGAYVDCAGTVRKIDKYNRTLVMTDNTVIPIEQISRICGLQDCEIDLWDMYADYINGKREIAEINMDFKPEYKTI